MFPCRCGRAPRGIPQLCAPALGQLARLYGVYAALKVAVAAGCARWPWVLIIMMTQWASKQDPYTRPQTVHIL